MSGIGINTLRLSAQNRNRVLDILSIRTKVGIKFWICSVSDVEPELCTRHAHTVPSLGGPLGSHFRSKSPSRDEGPFNKFSPMSPSGPPPITFYCMQLFCPHGRAAAAYLLLCTSLHHRYTVFKWSIQDRKGDNRRGMVGW